MFRMAGRLQAYDGAALTTDEVVRAVSSVQSRVGAHFTPGPFFYRFATVEDGSQVLQSLGAAGSYDVARRVVESFLTNRFIYVELRDDSEASSLVSLDWKLGACLRLMDDRDPTATKGGKPAWIGNWFRHVTLGKYYYIALPRPGSNRVLGESPESIFEARFPQCHVAGRAWPSPSLPRHPAFPIEPSGVAGYRGEDPGPDFSLVLDLARKVIELLVVDGGSQCPSTSRNEVVVVTAKPHGPILVPITLPSPDDLYKPCYWHAEPVSSGGTVCAPLPYCDGVVPSKGSYAVPPLLVQPKFRSPESGVDVGLDPC